MSVDTIITQFLTKGEDGLRSTLAGLSRDIDTFEGKQARLGLASNALVAGGAGVVGVLGLIGASSLKSAGDIERVEAGLTSMLGSSDAAKKKLGELQQFAKETPFDFGDTSKAAQQLLAMGVSADKLIPTMKGVGNAVAAGGGGTEEFAGVLMALGQIQTKGKMSAEELMQMAERGVPVFQILQDQLGMTKEQVADIGNSGLDAQVGIDALVKGMAEVGGGTGLETMSETLPGKLSNLGDSVNQLSGSIGKLFSQDAKDIIGSVGATIDKLRDFVTEYPQVAKVLLYGAGAAGIGLVTAGAIGKAAGIYNEVTDAMGKTTKAKKLLALATQFDDKAEKDKTVTAKKEGDAIASVGDAAEEVKSKVEDLAKEKIEEAIGDPKAMLAKVKTFLRSPLSIGGRNFSQLSAFGRGGGAVTGGGAALGAGIGVAAGLGVHSDLKALGYSETRAMVQGVGTGLAAAGAAMFVPGGAIAVGIGTGFRYLLEKAYTERVLDRTDNGPRDSEGNIINDESKSGKDFDTRIAYQMERAAKLRGTGNEEDMAEADAADRTAEGLRSGKRAADEAAAVERWRTGREAEIAASRKATEKAARDKALWDEPKPEVGAVTYGRNGSKRVVFVANMPESSGDFDARRNAYRGNTAAPVY